MLNTNYPSRDFPIYCEDLRNEVEDLYFQILESEGVDYLHYEEIDPENHITESWVKEDYNLSPEEMVEFIIDHEVTTDIEPEGMIL